MKWLIAILILAIFLIAGCVQQNTGIVCNSPYIRNGAGCCLDINSNSICDSDEANLCKGVICNNYCSMNNTLYYNGSCVYGQCKYSSQYCPYGCSNSDCNANPLEPPSEMQQIKIVNATGKIGVNSVEATIIVAPNVDLTKIAAYLSGVSILISSRNTSSDGSISTLFMTAPANLEVCGKILKITIASGAMQSKSVTC